MTQVHETTLPQHPFLVDIDLRPLDSEATLVITPGGNLFEVAAAIEQVESWLNLCDGRTELSEVLARCPSDFIEVLEVLAEDGCLSDKPWREADRFWLRFGNEVEPTRLQQVTLHIAADDLVATTLDRLKPYADFTQVQRTKLEDLKQRIPTLDSQSDLLVVVLATLDSELLLATNQLCSEHNITWVSFHLEGTSGWLGPLVIPGHTADYQDLHERRLCCADNRRMFDALVAKPQQLPRPQLPPTSEVAWMLGAFFLEIERFLVGAPCFLLSNEREADLRSLRFNDHPFLPMPHRRLQGPLRSSLQPNPQNMINPRSGLVVQSIAVRHHESVPDSLITYQAQVANIAARYEAANDVIVGGSSFGDEAQALASSLGETVERYCGNYIPGESLRRATYDQLKQAGEHAIDPESLALFEPQMYREEGCPMVPFTRDLPVLWVQGHSLTRDCPAWLPISLVYVNWYTALPKEPITNYMNFPGIAAGANLEHALVSAIEELVERDATMIWWMNRQPLPSIKLTADCEALWQGKPTQLGQRPWLIHLDNEFDIPVIAGVLENTREGFFNIGFACRPDAKEAAFKAWSEALTLQEGSRDMDDPNGLLRTSVEEWGLIEVPYKPWRKDRRYLDDYRSDFRDVSDLLQQQQVNLDPRALAAVREWVDTPAERTFEQLPKLPDRSLATYRQRIESKGFEIFYKDITTADVAHTGLAAARVIIPGLVPNTPAAFPPLGGGRLQQAAVDLGWRNRPLPTAALNYAPLPHA